MSGFTPGPWKVFRALSGENKGKLLGIGDAEAGGITDAYGGLWRSGEEMDANADLIAAAPDLYEALAALRLMASDIPAVATSEKFQAINMKALRALARARGETA